MYAAMLNSLFFICSFVVLVKCQVPSNLVSGKRHDVYIAGFFPYDKSIPESQIGRGVMPAVKLAVDHINDNPTVLRNYLLHMWWNDTQCNAAVGMKALFDMMHEGPHKLMLFGAACTQVTDPIAKASKHWRLTQLSYADTHPMFTNENFPNFFRIVPSENAFNAPRIKLCQTFNWTRIGTIYQNEPRYSLAHNRLVAELDVLKYTIVESQSFAVEVSSAMLKLREQDIRIILGNFNETWANMIFCEAYKTGMYGSKFQWLIMGTYSADWWLKNEHLHNCTLEELEIALEGCILTDLLPLSTNGEITVSGNTAEEYRVEYDSRRGSYYSRFHGYTYDGVWTVALAIQHVAHQIRHFRKNETMMDFRYRDPLWERLFVEALGNTSFEGVTGPVRFYGNERKASIMLKQFQGGKEVKIGEFNGVNEQLDLTRGHVIKWHGKNPPKDRTLQIVEHSQVNLTVYSVLAATACIGIIMAIIFLTINIIYRNQRYIKMSSPYLNNLIIIGCALTYSSVIFLGLDSQLTSVDAFPYICTARAWLLMSGFSLAFGSMFSKTWRVHSIFTDVKINKKLIKDYQLFMVVGVLVSIDLAIMTTWQVADPFYRETKRVDPYPHPSNDEIEIVPEHEYCQSEKMTIFVGSIYAYKGLLLIFGAFLAWETRHVSIPALNDSKYVGMSVYNVTMMCVMGAAISFVLSDKQDASFIIISVFIIFCTTATLCLVFVPKLIELKRNPAGVIDKKTRATLRPISNKRRDSEVSEMEDKLKDAKLMHSKYRKQLLDIESELQVLVRRLGAEANSIIEPLDRLSVPLLKKEGKTAPSGTETTEISSLCSLNSSQDDEFNMDLGPKKKSSFAKKTTFADETKQESILRKNSDAKPKTRFSDEIPPKNVSFGDQKPKPKPDLPPSQPLPPQQSQPLIQPSQQPPIPVIQPQRAQFDQSQNLERLGITQIHPKPNPLKPEPPRQYYEPPPPITYYQERQTFYPAESDRQAPQQYYKETEQPRSMQFYQPEPPLYRPTPYCPSHPQYEDETERQIQEVTSHLTSQLLKQHDQQYQYEESKRRSSVKSANISGAISQLQQRRTSVPCTYRSNEPRSANKNIDKKLYQDGRISEEVNRCKKHGSDIYGSDLENYGSEKDISDNDWSSKELSGYSSNKNVVKYIEKDKYWVSQSDNLVRRGSGSQKSGRHSPYLLKDQQQPPSRESYSPTASCGSLSSAQNQDSMAIQRSVSERGHRLPSFSASRASHEEIDYPPPCRMRPQQSIDNERRHIYTDSAKTNFHSNLTHVLSTPDVAAIRPYYDSKTFNIYATEKRSKIHKNAGSAHLSTAVSEGELLDVAILPIFQKLLTERHKSRSGYGASIASCPNISIKCDIVEYL